MRADGELDDAARRGDDRRGARRRWTGPSRPPSGRRSSRSRTSPASSTPTRSRAADDAQQLVADDVPRGDARGDARGHAARRAGVPDGRGRRQVRRLLRGEPGAARRVRARTDPRHPAVGVGVRRGRHRGGDGWDAAHRRDHDRQLQPAGARPDPQQRRDAAAHVRRPGLGSARDPDDHRCRPTARRAALAQPGGLVRPHPRDQGAGTRDRRGRPRHVVAGAAGPRPGADLRARLALRRAGLARSTPVRSTSAVPPYAVPAPTSRCVTYGGSLPKALAAAEELATTGSTPRSSTCGCCGPWTTQTIAGSVRRTHRAVIVDEGWRTGSLSAEITTRLVEQCFFDLDAPVERVCSAEVPMPYAKHLEEAALPQLATIVAAARRMVSRMTDFTMPSLGADMDSGTLAGVAGQARRPGPARRRRWRWSTPTRRRSRSSLSRAAWSATCWSSRARGCAVGTPAGDPAAPGRGTPPRHRRRGPRGGRARRPRPGEQPQAAAAHPATPPCGTMPPSSGSTLADVTGTGPGGEVTRHDVDAAAARAAEHERRPWTPAPAPRLALRPPARRRARGRPRRRDRHRAGGAVRAEDVRAAAAAAVGAVRPRGAARRAGRPERATGPLRAGPSSPP